MKVIERERERECTSLREAGRERRLSMTFLVYKKLGSEFGIIQRQSTDTLVLKVV